MNKILTKQQRLDHWSLYNYCIMCLPFLDGAKSKILLGLLKSNYNTSTTLSTKLVTLTVRRFSIAITWDEILLGIEEEVWLSGEGTKLEPGDPEFKCSSDHRMDSFNSLAVLLQKKAVCPLPVGILNRIQFTCCISGPQCKLPVLPVIV